jgi:transcriptional regulator of acetoin/glycerol metabolism
MDKRIAEVAKLLGVSRQTIYNKIDKENLHHFTKDTDKGKVINAEGITALKGILFPANETVNGQSNFGDDSKYVDTLIDSLKSENTHLKAMNIEQSKQLDNLTRLLENSQVLLKQHQEKVFLLESQSSEKQAESIIEQLNKIESLESKIESMNEVLKQQQDKIFLLESPPVEKEISFWGKLNPFKSKYRG